MPAGAPRYTRLKAALIKIEATYGVDPVPAGATDALLMKDDPQVDPVINTAAERNLVQTYMGNSAKVIVGTNMQFKLTCELQASGVAGTKPGAALDALLQAAGMASTIVAATSVTYNLISAALPSCTIYFNRAGLLQKLLGCRVSTVEIALSPLGIPYITFTGLGLFGGVVDAALPAVTLTAYKTPQGVNNANTLLFSVGGYAALMYDFKATLNNKVKYRNVPGAEDILLTDRSGSFSVEIEEPTIAAKDFFTVARAGTIIVGTVTHGSTAGSKSQVNVNVQLNDPKQTDRDGVAALQMGGDLTPVTGNDELAIVFT
ncbi:MAG TPA: phage tail tube protein [Usitatibacteraceae bacterium]